MLLAREWDANLIRQFFLVIDWIMALPPVLAEKLTAFVTELEDERKMEYVSSIERVLLARERQTGRQEGRQEGQEQGSGMSRRWSYILNTSYFCNTKRILLINPVLHLLFETALVYPSQYRRHT